MKFLKVLRVGTAALFASAWLIGFSSGRAQAQEVQWHRIFGIPEAFNVVGSGTGAAPRCLHVRQCSPLLFRPR